MAMAENVDQAKHVQEALRYLDQKDVKKLLRDLTESVLLRQPENPKFHMLEELWEQKCSLCRLQKLPSGKPLIKYRSP